MDFADLVWSVVCSANRDEVFSAALASRWLYVMVDEYQDTNDLQEQLVAHIARIHRNIMVVGDDDQSIYAFRGSKVEHILTFPDRWDGVKTIYLGQNYRSTPQIVSTAADDYQLEEVENLKNEAIKEIQAELKKIREAHSNMVKTYEGKLSEFGIPVEELGFDPLVPANI